MLPRDPGAAHQAPRCPWTSEFITSCWKGLCSLPSDRHSWVGPSTGRFPPAGGGSIPILLKGEPTPPHSDLSVLCVGHGSHPPFFKKPPGSFNTQIQFLPVPKTQSVQSPFSLGNI